MQTCAESWLAESSLLVWILPSVALSLRPALQVALQSGCPCSSPWGYVPAPIVPAKQGMPFPDPRG